MSLALALVPACRGGDSTPADGGGESSTGQTEGFETEGSGSTIGLDETGTLDATSEASTTEGGETDSDTETTGEPMGEPSLRLIHRGDYDTPGYFGVFQRDLIDGVLTEPVRISEAGAPNVDGWRLSPSQRNFIYEVAEDSPRYYHVARDAEGNAGAATAVEVPSGPAPDAYDEPYFSADETALYFHARWSAPARSQYYRAEISDGVLGTPQLLADSDSLPGSITTAPMRVSHDGGLAAFSVSEAEAGTDLWIAPHDTPDPTAVVRISDMVEPFSGAGGAVFSPNDDWLYYRADREFNFVDEWFAVNISGPAPTDPIRVHPPLMDGEDTVRTAVSPDGTRVAYFIGESARGEIYLLEIDGPTVALPMRLSTLGDGEASAAMVEWSADGRYLMYEATHEGAPFDNIYVVDMSGPMPSAPMPALGEQIHPDTSANYAVFSPSGDALYVIAAFDSMFDEQLYRVDLSGPVPGQRQQVNGLLTDGEDAPNSVLAIAGFSHDENSLVYYARQDDPDRPGLYWVDVSGEQPGEPQRVDPLEGTAWPTLGVRFSPDDHIIVYSEDAGVGEPRPAKYVHVDALGEAHDLLDDGQGLALVDH